MSKDNVDLKIQHGSLQKLSDISEQNGIIYFTKDDNFNNGKIYYDSPLGEGRIEVSGVGYDVSGQEFEPIKVLYLVKVRKFLMIIVLVSFMMTQELLKNIEKEIFLLEIILTLKEQVQLPLEMELMRKA